MFNHSHILNNQSYSILTTSTFPHPYCIADKGACSTFGDNHGNTITALSDARYLKYLIISDSDFERLAIIFYLPITEIKPEHIKEIDDIFLRIKSPESAKESSTRYLGDLFAERVGFIYIQLKLFRKLREENILYRLIISNHDYDLLYCYEKKLINKNEIFQPVTNTNDCAQSIINMQYLITKGILKDEVIMEYIEKYVYDPDILIPLDYTASIEKKLNSDNVIVEIIRISYFTHAPFDNNHFKKLASNLKVVYKDRTPHERMNTLKNIKSAFREYVIQKKVTSIPGIVEYVWHRDFDEDMRDADANYINGHHLIDAYDEPQNNELNMDNTLGKGIEMYFTCGESTILYSHDTTDPDQNLFRQEVLALESRIPIEIVKIFERTLLTQLINFDQIYSRKQLLIISDLFCQTNSVAFWKSLITDNKCLKLTTIKINRNPDFWGVLWFLQKIDMLNLEMFNSILLNIEYCHDLFQMLSILFNYDSGKLWGKLNVIRLLNERKSCYKIIKFFIATYHIAISIDNTSKTLFDSFVQICMIASDNFTYNQFYPEILIKYYCRIFPKVVVDQFDNDKKLQLCTYIMHYDEKNFVFNQMNLLIDPTRAEMHYLKSHPLSLNNIVKIFDSFTILQTSGQVNEYNERIKYRKHRIKNILDMICQLTETQNILSLNKINFIIPDYIYNFIIQKQKYILEISHLCQLLISAVNLKKTKIKDLQMFVKIFSHHDSFIYLLEILHNQTTINGQIKRLFLEYKYFGIIFNILQKNQYLTDDNINLLQDNKKPLSIRSKLLEKLDSNQILNSYFKTIILDKVLQENIDSPLFSLTTHKEYIYDNLLVLLREHHLFSKGNITWIHQHLDNMPTIHKILSFCISENAANLQTVWNQLLSSSDNELDIIYISILKKSGENKYKHATQPTNIFPLPNTQQQPIPQESLNQLKQ